MHISRKNIYQIGAAIFICLTIFSCDRTRNNPGYDYMPDMVYSQAYETSTPNPVLPNNMTNLAPVEGTMSNSRVAFRFDVIPENRMLAGQTLMGDDEINMKYVFDGKKLYKDFCQNCHGIKGKGNGFLYTSKKLPVKPGDLSQERLVQASRGELFHTISIGYGLMKPHAAQLTESDRWKIVEYVKVKLQGQKIGERTLGSGNDALSEPYEEFEARIAKTYPQTIGFGPVKSLQLGAINQGMVDEGKELFKVKCSSCHKPLKKYIGPAPKGIMDRRSPEWIMNMILDPEGMVANDPVAKALLERYLSPMANQSLTEEESRKILEYFRTLE